MRTNMEQYATIKERTQMSAWFKDTISGLFLMTFIAASFGMADIAHFVLSVA